MGLTRRSITTCGASVLATAAAPGLAMAEPKVGAPAPPFSLTTFDHTRVTLAELAGKVVVLNYWATWCGPCKREMPLLHAYVQTHPDLKVFAVATEDSAPRAQLAALAAALSFPLAFDLRGGGYRVLDGVPTNYVIDRAGVLRYAKAAAFTAERLQAVVGPLLAEPAPTPPPAGRAV